MKKILLTYSVWVLSTLCVFSQTEDATADDEIPVKPELNEELKAGVKLGLGMSALIGNESNTSVPQLMLTGGAYVRYRFSTNWMLQPEVSIVSKGGRFNNRSGEYGQIRCYLIEAPILLMYGFDKQNVNCVYVGAGYARVINSSLYKVGAYLPESSNIGLTKNDFFVATGMQFHTPFVGFQIGLKYGLINANNGLVSTVPPANQGKNLNHISFEIQFLF